MNQQTRALFEAHVAHELRAQATQEQAELAAWTRQLFTWLEGVPLDDLLTREQVLGVIQRYVIDLRISGGIAELAGQMAQIGFLSRVGAETRVDELLTEEAYRGFADKIQSLEGAYRELVQLIARTRSLRPLLARAFALSASKLLFERGTSETSPGPLARIASELKSNVVDRLEQSLARYLELHADKISQAIEAHWHATFDLDSVRTLSDELWDSVSGMRLSELLTLIDTNDLEDFVVLGYETWLKFRQTDYFRANAELVVDAFFRKYGSESVHALLDDMGVTEAMVAHELSALVSPMLAYAARTGLLEQRVRARLEAFYTSQPATDLLAQPQA